MYACTHTYTQIAPVAWVNMTVFDYASKLQSGSVTLYAWPIQTELEESINYMGSTTLNPSTTECVSLGIEIPPPPLPPHIPNRGKPIMYPSYDQIRAFAHEVSQVAIPAVSYITPPHIALKPSDEACVECEILATLLSRNDAFYHILSMHLYHLCPAG